jgi:hypothetical protein
MGNSRVLGTEISTEANEGLSTDKPSDQIQVLPFVTFVSSSKNLLFLCPLRSFRILEMELDNRLKWTRPQSDRL